MATKRQIGSNVRAPEGRDGTKSRCPGAFRSRTMADEFRHFEFGGVREKKQRASNNNMFGRPFWFFFFVLFTAPGTKRARSVLDVRGRKSISIIEIFFNENDTFYKLSEIDSSPY